MKINVAIIGLGVVGKKRREFIKNNKNYNLIAVSDVLFKKNFVRNKVSYFKNFEDIFKMNAKLDAIFITLAMIAGFIFYSFKKKYSCIL